jgi:hypothetical protein
MRSGIVQSSKYFISDMPDLLGHTPIGGLTSTNSVKIAIARKLRLVLAAKAVLANLHAHGSTTLSGWPASVAGAPTPSGCPRPGTSRRCE